MKTATLNSKQAAEVFDISHMTLFTWRKGTRSLDPLPTVEIPSKTGARAGVGFKPKDLTRWAKKHGITIVRDPEAVLAEAPTEHPAGKPGPKPRSVKATPKKPGKAAAKKTSKGKSPKLSPWVAPLVKGAVAPRTT